MILWRFLLTEGYLPIGSGVRLKSFKWEKREDLNKIAVYCSLKYKWYLSPGHRWELLHPGIDYFQRTACAEVFHSLHYIKYTVSWVHVKIRALPHGMYCAVRDNARSCYLPSIFLLIFSFILIWPCLIDLRNITKSTLHRQQYSTVHRVHSIQFCTSCECFCPEYS